MCWLVLCRGKWASNRALRCRRYLGLCRWKSTDRARRVGHRRLGDGQEELAHCCLVLLRLRRRQEADDRGQPCGNRGHREHAHALLREAGGLFGSIAFGRGEAPSAPAAAAPLPSPGLQPAATSQTATLDDFTVMGRMEGYVGADGFIEFLRNTENGVKERGMFEGRGPAAILLLVFLGGLALNLTPCVLPMIPINLAIIGAGAHAGSRGRGLLLGATYGAAMALVYGVLGLIVILTAGTFGTINASPWFNAAIALVFVVLALAMFDVVTIDFSGLSNRFRAGGAARGSVPVAFAMGAVAALLAGACVAPVVVQVVLLSSRLYAAGSGAALALPFVLGLGMAAPWPVAGAGIAALPKPGAWMVRVKQGLGVVILLTAAYYGYEAYGIFANRWVDASEVAASVQEKLKALGAHIVGVEGRRNGDWVLVDLGDIVVHVMHPAVRSHYNLEELWGGKEVRQKPKAKARTKAKAKAKAKPAAKKPKRPRAKTARPRRRK